MMNKTKSLGILLAATLLYMVWLSPSTAGPIPQILKPALAQDVSPIFKKGLVAYGSIALC